MRLVQLSSATVRFSFILLAILLPFFVIPASWVSVAQGKLLILIALILVALVSFCVARVTSGHAIVPRHAVFFAAALLPLCYLLSAWLSGASVDSYVSGFGDQETVATMTILFAMLALAGIAFAGRGAKATLPLLALLFGGGIVILFQAARLFFLAALSLGGAMAGSASSVLGGWHDLGIFFGLVLLLSVVLAHSTEISKK